MRHFIWINICLKASRYSAYNNIWDVILLKVISRMMEGLGVTFSRGRLLRWLRLTKMGHIDLESALIFFRVFLRLFHKDSWCNFKMMLKFCKRGWIEKFRVLSGRFDLRSRSVLKCHCTQLHLQKWWRGGNRALLLKRRVEVALKRAPSTRYRTTCGNGLWSPCA